ncbi:tRNA (guanosine(46)-N7)-methyltransferase TrmB [Kaistia dalseonensis]|uniref:tRNA (guanine-N(7)-)-methyltransferase n=1 Tax=Kaistia dalseonensis TaxID=410840 RepID=A0ABU0H5B2_9HYPH|nr:tRNA (guanosine(46)-N7)-methyltransferase TrmB [Kaistia dalseonensis]MCX5494910.1 tRNA (guanosine(46)-N7)-methyltransferase TrmB [Kaistia dalseonensis]MDQ0437491.1 tRNA (guanine-N7-)-methyltransferase [Kaistia dalseonensis]
MTAAETETRRDSFYGRRKGHALRAGQAETLERVLARLSIDTDSPAPAALVELFPAPVGDVVLEIGFGGGEHLIHRATTEPATGRIGVEPFINGMAKAARAIAEQGLENVRLFDRDAAELLDWLPSESVTAIDLLYPDPWPKTRHWKRRFVSAKNLDRFARVLKPGGLFRFASDIESYVDWTLTHVAAHPAFAWTARDADDWRRPWDGWPGTRYERKALREGRTGTYLTFQRR